MVATLAFADAALTGVLVRQQQPEQCDGHTVWP